MLESPAQSPETASGGANQTTPEVGGAKPPEATAPLPGSSETSSPYVETAEAQRALLEARAKIERQRSEEAQSLQAEQRPATVLSSENMGGGSPTRNKLGNAKDSFEEERRLAISRRHQANPERNQLKAA